MPTERRIWATQGFEGGLNTQDPAHTLGGEYSPDAENFDPGVRRMCRKRLGTNDFTGAHGSPTGTVVSGLFSGVFENGTSKIVAKEGTALYDITAGNWSTTITGHPTLSDGDEVHMIMFKNVVIMTSQEAAPIAPQKWSGSGSWSNLGGSPPAGQYPAVHNNRVWIANTAADPSRIYYSAINNHEDWSTVDNAGNLYVTPGDGMVINGIASDGEVLYISKVASGGTGGAIYAIFGNGPASYTPPRRIAWFGAVGHRGMCLTQSFVAAACQTGIYGLQGTRLVYLSEAVNATWMGLTSTQKLVACLGRFNDQLWVCYPASGSTNTKALVVDLRVGRWSRYSNMNYRIFTTDWNGVMYGGSNASSVRVAKLNTGATDIGSTAITMYWSTPMIDFGAWYADKKLGQSFIHAKDAAVTWAITRAYNGGSFGDSYNVTGNASGLAPVQLVAALASDNFGRFISIKASESDTSLSGELYGLQMEADIFDRTR